MSHFAYVVNGLVENVIVAEQDFIDNVASKEFPDGKWIQTSYNTRGGVHYKPDSWIPSEDQSKALRKNYAEKDFIYDEELDAFYAPQPYPSWTLDKETCVWVAPSPMPEPDPENKIFHYWDEEQLAWVQYASSEEPTE